MNILISSVGRRTYLIDYFEDCLSGIGKVYVSNSIRNSSGMMKTNNSILLPESFDKNYINELLAESIKRDIKLIIPQHDLDTLRISIHRKNFIENNIIPVIADYKSNIICLDKLLANRFLRKLGLPVTRTYLNIKSFIYQLKNKTASFPVILKPRFGYASRNIIKVDTLDELIKAYEFLKIILSKELLPFPFRSRKLNIFIEEYIDGEEFGADIVNDLNGNFVGVYVKKKLSMRSGETEIAETIKMPSFQKYANIISNNLSYLGNLDVDFILGKNGNKYIIDLNPRFGGGYPFTHHAGVNLPKAIVAWAQNKQISKDDFEMKIGLLLSKNLIISSNQKNNLIK